MDKRLRRHPLGFLEIINRPTEEELREYYEQQYFQTQQGSYRSTYPDNELKVIRQRVRQRAQIVNEIRDSTLPARVLDVGCGEGFVLAFLQDWGWEVEGLDYSLAGVEAINPDVAQYVVSGNVFELLTDRIESDRQYELVWLGNVLEHVLDPLGLLRSIHRIVSADGLLVVTVPNDDTVYHEALFQDKLIAERFWIAPPDHMSYFNNESLVQTAEATGWECRDMLADFPINFFLSHPGSNYANQPSLGPAAHQARLRIEDHIGQAGDKAANDFYRSLARLNLGRTLTAFLTPKSQEINNG